MLDINLVDVINALKACIVTAGKNDIRHQLNGVLINFEYNTVVLVGTDGYRLTLCELDVCVGFDLIGRSVILSRPSVESFLKTTSKLDETTTLTAVIDTKGIDKLTISGFDFEIIRAVFPAYEHILELSFTGHVDEINFNIDYIADIKKAFNHLKNGKDLYIEQTFYSSTGASRFKPRNLKEDRQLKEVAMYIMPASNP